MRLHMLTSNARPGSFKAVYRTLLELEEAKREYLLASLVTHYPNVVDNLTTKENLSYEDLKVGLAIIATTSCPTITVVTILMPMLNLPCLQLANQIIKLEERKPRTRNLLLRPKHLLLIQVLGAVPTARNMDIVLRNTSLFPRIQWNHRKV
ncbi:hypothetical protein BGX38DRAFT_1175962 [Terfezia claveryi]|nr:hypothetical protein BGX38DRAFT_1175962 [Terfezia claveryi]